MYNLIPHSKLREMVASVKQVMFFNNPEYDILTKNTYLYYDMTLVTFGIRSDVITLL